MSPIIHERSFCNGICIGWTLVGTAAAGCDCAGSVDQRSDLFAGLRGIFSGAVIYAVAANLGVAGVFSSVSDLMIEKMGGNAALLLFVVLLGALVAVITKAGGSAAYGSWAAGQTAFWHQRAACHRFFGAPDFY